MRRLLNILLAVMILLGVALTAYSPDTMSVVFSIVMLATVIIGIIKGIYPLMRYSRGLENGMESIDRAEKVQTESAFLAVLGMESFFGEPTLDGMFAAYQEKIREQRKSGQLLSNIEDYINEDSLSAASWQSVTNQVPSTLTGLGILGTFIGLIMGITGVSFSTVDEALESVGNLLSGIEVAFYTSIAGISLALVFNIADRLAWNTMTRNLDVFVERFHQEVIPSVEEQERYRSRKEIAKIIEALDRIPKNGYFTAGGGTSSETSAQDESTLMPQILADMKTGRFTFYLQPQCDLNSRKIIGAEALVRWNHVTLGVVSPAVFMPVLEKNGYVTKMDQYIWDSVCSRIRKRIDTGAKVLPVAVNVTKTDILSLDIPKVFKELLAKYQIPPRDLVIEISENAYLQAYGAVSDAERALIDAGFSVVVDGFDGDYMRIENLGKIQADTAKLDLRLLGRDITMQRISQITSKMDTMFFAVTAEGIESMEQLQILKKCGCTKGQGYFFSKPMSCDDFERIIDEAANI